MTSERENAGFSTTLRAIVPKGYFESPFRKSSRADWGKRFCAGLSGLVWVRREEGDRSLLLVRARRKTITAGSAMPARSASLKERRPTWREDWRSAPPS